MKKEYYIVHIPPIFNLMDLIGKTNSPLDILRYLTSNDHIKLTDKNYTKFLRFDLNLRRRGGSEIFGIETYAAHYIANQIAKIKPNSRIIITDDRRVFIEKIIKDNGKPKAVFITSMSANFPTTVAITIPLNHGKIPVIIGGIHVSTMPKDINLFIKKYVPNPNLISYVKGAGDSITINQILNDVSTKNLKDEYVGITSIENKVWGGKNITFLPKMNLSHVSRIPFIGKIGEKFCVNLATPYLGCQFSCNFCSISSMDKKIRKFMYRDPDDFISELKNYQKNGVSTYNRVFFFLPDNLLIGGKILEQILDKMIASNLKINYMAQISIDVANNEKILKKLRLSGATHFLIGLESLNLQNLKAIGKSVVKDIEKSKLTVTEYYSKQIKIIQKYGISIWGGFMFGLPYDFFNNLNDHSGTEIIKFCKKNKIGIQPTCLTDLPGSLDFIDSQKNRKFIYGKIGTMDYLISLCVCDAREGNRIIHENKMKHSPLVVAYMAYNAAQKVGSTIRAIKSGIYMSKKAWQFPTQKGRKEFKERIFDSFSGFGAQIAVALEKENHDVIAYSTKYFKGSFERLYEIEENNKVKEIFKHFIENYKYDPKK